MEPLQLALGPGRRHEPAGRHGTWAIFGNTSNSHEIWFLGFLGWGAGKILSECCDRSLLGLDQDCIIDQRERYSPTPFPFSNTSAIRSPAGVPEQTPFSHCSWHSSLRTQTTSTARFCSASLLSAKAEGEGMPEDKPVEKPTGAAAAPSAAAEKSSQPATASAAAADAPPAGATSSRPKVSSEHVEATAYCRSFMTEVAKKAAAGETLVNSLKVETTLGALLPAQRQPTSRGKWIMHGCLSISNPPFAYLQLLDVCAHNCPFAPPSQALAPLVACAFAR